MLAGLISVLGCTVDQPEATPAHYNVEVEGCERGRAPASLSEPVVVIQTRDHDVAVHATPSALSFSVTQAQSGTPLAVQLTEAEFSKSFPRLHQSFQTAFAEDSSIWAGL